MKKPYEALFRQIIALLKESLDKKWTQGADYNLNEKCPFCWHAVDQIQNDSFMYMIEMCDICLCPDVICNQCAKEGFIQDLFKIYYKYTNVFDLKEADLLKMRDLFQAEIDRLEADLAKI